jgi:hypothetical protein
VTRRILWICLAALIVMPSESWAQGNPHMISGSPASSSTNVITINQEYCDTTAAYSYRNGETTELPGSTQAVTSPISNFESFEDPGTAILAPGRTGLMSDGSDAARLLARTFFAGACGTKSRGDLQNQAVPSRLSTASYYIINIVSWKKSGKGSAFEIASNEWFTFNLRDGSVARQTPFGRFHPEVSQSDRIYGSKDIGFLAVHLKTDIGEDTFKSLDIRYNVSVKEKQPINIQDLMALIGVLKGTALAASTGAAPPPPPPPPPKFIGLYGGGLLGSISRLPDDIVFEAKITFPKPAAPEPDTHKSVSGFSPVGQSAGAGARFVLTRYQAKGKQPMDAAGAQAAGSGADGDTSTKSVQACDGTIDPKTNQQVECSFSKTFDDEGLYHWDVSVGVPVNSIKELQYSSTDGQVTGKTVSRLNAYGFFDIYPVPTDLKSPPGFGWPHIMVGLPFSGKVFNKPFFGAGGVINPRQLPKIGPGISKIVPLQLNFYGGLVYNKEFRPGTLSVGSSASPGAVSNDLQPHRVWKGQFGIEFSIRDVKDKLTGSKKSDTSAKSTNANP